MRLSRLASRWSLLVLALLLVACDESVAPRAAEPTAVTISGVLTPEQRAVVAAMSVEVTGPGIPEPIVAELDVGATTVNGTVQVPAGPDRVFTLRAFDASGQEIYRGSTTVRVADGENPPLTVRMTPRLGTVPIDVVIGGALLQVTPDSIDVVVGATVSVVATVSDGEGGIIGDGTVAWGALNPTLVRLTPASQGRSLTIRGLIPGTTRVVAVIDGVAAAIVVVVGPGDGTTVTRYASIVAGAQHSCGLTAAGVPYCWGRNADGQLGDGTQVDRGAPVRVGGTSGPLFTAIGAGFAHTCGVTSGGAVHCWGRNSTGQLGDGTLERRLVPTPVPGLTAAALSLGDAHTCAWSFTLGGDRGPVSCWGDNSSGQLGDGTTTTRSAPTPVAGGWDGGRLVSAGGAHSCGFLSTGGSAATSLRCWGSNDFRQIDGTTTFLRTTPTVLDPAPDVTTVTSGTWHSCGLAPSGAAVCWGYNASGQLGFASGTASPPGTVGGGLTFTMLDAGDRSTCGRTSGGQVWCWGGNDQGQLGNGTQAPSTAPVQAAGTGFTTVTAGDAHACALDAEGAAWCWGANANGQLGDGTFTRRLVPTRVAAP